MSLLSSGAVTRSRPGRAIRAKAAVLMSSNGTLYQCFQIKNRKSKMTLTLGATLNLSIKNSEIANQISFPSS